MSKNNTLILVGGLVALVVLIVVVAFVLLSGQPSFDTQAFEDYIMRAGNDELTVQSVEVDTSGDVASTIEVTANEPCYAFGYITSYVSGYEDLDTLTLNINSNTDTAISTTIPMSDLTGFFTGEIGTAEFDVYVPEVCKV